MKTAAGDQVKGCLEKHSLIKASLASVVFGKGRSCLRNLLKFFEAIMASTVFKEHSKAQDLRIFSVPHQSLRDACRTWPTSGLGVPGFETTIKIAENNLGWNIFKAGTN